MTVEGLLGAGARALETHVRALATGIGERHVRRPHALEEAACYIEEAWERAGFVVASQVYDVEGVACRNLEVEVPAAPGGDGRILVVGAHYDTVPGSPGADDNASGVALLIEGARALRGKGLRRAVRFVAFVNEEPPWFHTPRMGSNVYAARCVERGEKVHAMLCLESLGYFRHDKGSQAYPALLGFLYPDVGDFVAVVGNLRSRVLVREVSRALREADVPVQTLVSPLALPGVDWSDHASFWAHGFPAVMLTDTAPFRNPSYHRESDLPEDLDYALMGRIGAGLVRAVDVLGG